MAIFKFRELLVLKPRCVLLYAILLSTPGLSQTLHSMTRVTVKCRNTSGLYQSPTGNLGSLRHSRSRLLIHRPESDPFPNSCTWRQLRHNPIRTCRKWSRHGSDRVRPPGIISLDLSKSLSCHSTELSGIPQRVDSCSTLDTINYDLPERPKPLTSSITSSKATESLPTQPFRFLDLPRELRDEVFSYLLLAPSRNGTPIFTAGSILQSQKLREKKGKARARANAARIAAGKRPRFGRYSSRRSQPWADTSILLANKQLYLEAKDYMYANNWFGISFSTFVVGNSPLETFKIPIGWNTSRISKLQLELQLKDAQRMNHYVDWARFFNWFPNLRRLTVIPTFHPRYAEWVREELKSWDDMSFIWKGFFATLLHAIRKDVKLKLGSSVDKKQDMLLAGEGTVERHVLRRIARDVEEKVESPSRSYGGRSVLVDLGEESDTE